MNNTMISNSQNMIDSTAPQSEIQALGAPKVPDMQLPRSLACFPCEIHYQILDDLLRDRIIDVDSGDAKEGFRSIDALVNLSNTTPILKQRFKDWIDQRANLHWFGSKQTLYDPATTTFSLDLRKWTPILQEMTAILHDGDFDRINKLHQQIISNQDQIYARFENSPVLKDAKSIQILVTEEFIDKEPWTTPWVGRLKFDNMLYVWRALPRLPNLESVELVVEAQEDQEIKRRAMMQTQKRWEEAGRSFESIQQYRNAFDKLIPAQIFRVSIERIRTLRGKSLYFDLFDEQQRCMSKAPCTCCTSSLNLTVTFKASHPDLGNCVAKWEVEPHWNWTRQFRVTTVMIDFREYAMALSLRWLNQDLEDARRGFRHGGNMMVKVMPGDGDDDKDCTRYGRVPDWF